MTDTERYRRVAAILKAKADGSEIEYTGTHPVSVCKTFAATELLDHPERYRIKPQPKTRPWSKPEDVPGPVCWLKRGAGPGCGCLILGVHPSGVLITRFEREGPTSLRWEEVALEGFKYSTDRKNWSKCEVVEESL